MVIMMNEMFKEYMMNHASYVLKEDKSLSAKMICYLKTHYTIKDNEDFLVKNRCTLFSKNIYALTMTHLSISPKVSICLKGIKQVVQKDYKTCDIYYQNDKITLSCSEEIYHDLCHIVHYYKNIKEDADVLYKECDFEKAIELYSELYNQGYKDELDCIGACYEGMKNIKKAIDIYNYALEDYDDQEQYYIKAKQLFDHKDYVKSYVYFKKANDCGYTKACFYIGRIYHYGFVFDKDLDKAKHYYNEALLHYHDERIHYHMAVLYRELKDYEDMHNHLNQSPSDRIPYFKGKLYHKGIGVKKDLKKAKKYYEESLKYSLKAYYPLASIALERRDFEDYFKYLMLSYNEGDKRATHHLGLAYEKGRGVSKDYNQALYYYYEAIKDHNAYAYFNLARMYKDGKGVEKDINKAIELLEISASLNYGGAYSELGKMYIEGTLEKDIDKGIRYVEKGLALHSENAKVYMAILSIEGEYVKEDTYYAYKLLKDAMEKETNGNNAKKTFIKYVLDDVFHLELDELSLIFDYALIVKEEDKEFEDEFKKLVSYYKKEFVDEYIKGCMYNALTNALFFYKAQKQAHFVDVKTLEEKVVETSKLKNVRHALSVGTPVTISYENNEIVSVKLSYEESLIK